MIQIDMEMPKSCDECPCVIYTAEEKKAIGYCNTSNEDYYCKALDRFMEYDKVDGGVDILGKPNDCPLKEVNDKPSGKWKIHDGILAHLLVCSNCGNEINITEAIHLDYYKKHFKYCPNCGCAMVEEQGEAE